MLTYKRALAFVVVAAFAEEAAMVLHWLIDIVLNVGVPEAVWGIGRSGIALAANAALIYGLGLLVFRRRRRRGGIGGG